MKIFNCHYHVNKSKQRFAHSIPNSFIHFHETRSKCMKLVTKKCTLWHEQITPNQHAPTNRLSTWHYNTSWSLLTFKWTNGHVAINSQLSSQDSNVSFMTTLICFMDHTSIKLLSKICLIYQQFHKSYFYGKLDEDDSKMIIKTWWTCSQIILVCINVHDLCTSW